MQFLVWSSTLASAACAQHEAPAPQRQAQGVVIDDSGLCLYVHDWWQLNSQRFLHTGLRRLPPSDAMVERDIVPALRAALDKVAKSDANGDGDGDTATNDLVGACLIALARIGHEVPRSPLADTFAGYLRHPNQAVREAAALALGMAGVDGPRERDLLVQLVRGDMALGPVVGEGPSVRTRAFATYGLGLLANQSTRLATQRTVFQTAQWILRQEPRDVDLQVAALHALSLLHLPDEDKAATTLRTETLEVLDDTLASSAEPGDLVACACPTAIGKLLGRDHARSGEFVVRFAQELGRNQPTKLGRPSVAQSCAIALGLLTKPTDATTVKELATAAAGHPDQNARMFACLALGEIGGTEARSTLLDLLVQPKDPYQVYAREWAAMALGISVRKERPTAQEQEAIDRAFLAAAQGPTRSGLLVAAGMARAEATVATLWERNHSPSNEEAAVAYCQALQLLEKGGALKPLRALFEASQRRCEQRAAAARAMASLGEEGLATELIHTALSTQSIAHQSANLMAAAELVAEPEVEALLQAFADLSHKPLLRAFLAVDLGTVARRSPGSWALPLSVHINHLAAPPTLSRDHAGVLDLL